MFGKIDHEPAAERMVELLGHPRGDVKVAAAWGLTQLRVADVLSDMLDHAESVYEGLKSGQLNARMPGVTFHLAHLCLAFGDQGYTAAEPLLLKLVPKSYGTMVNIRGLLRSGPWGCFMKTILSPNWFRASWNAFRMTKEWFPKLNWCESCAL